MKWLVQANVLHRAAWGENSTFHTMNAGQRVQEKVLQFDFAHKPLTSTSHHAACNALLAGTVEHKTCCQSSVQGARQVSSTFDRVQIIFSSFSRTGWQFVAVCNTSRRDVHQQSLPGKHKLHLYSLFAAVVTICSYCCRQASEVYTLIAQHVKQKISA